jgi:hypothetical protein
MIVLNKKLAYVSYYLAEKEYFLPDNLRKALSLIHYLISNKRLDKALAIHQVNEKYKKKGINYSKEFLWKSYNARLAHIKNGNDKFEKWSLEIRQRNSGLRNPLCQCGCGMEVTKKNNKFINGHNAKCRTEEENIELALHMRNIRNTQKSNNVISMLNRIPKKP